MKKLLLAICCVMFAGTMVLADPLPGEQLKFQQLPMDGVTIDGVSYWGHDELSTATAAAVGGNIYYGDFMADDFADRFAKPVVHVKWWGSYLEAPTDPIGVRRFLISFESDIPAGSPGPDGTTLSYSRPGQPLLNQIVSLGQLAPGSGTFTETLKSPGGDPLNEALYEYNAELKCPFEQKPDTVYWLKIVALDDSQPGTPPTLWGWHNRDYTVMDPFASTPPAVVPGEHIQGVIPDALGIGTPIWHFQDDAVAGFVSINIADTGVDCEVQIEQDVFGPQHYLDGIDGPGPIVDADFPGIGAYSKDLAFELYYIPEPATVSLLALGAVGALLRRRRRG